MRNLRGLRARGCTADTYLSSSATVVSGNWMRQITGQAHQPDTSVGHAGRARRSVVPQATQVLLGVALCVYALIFHVAHRPAFYEFGWYDSFHASSYFRAFAHAFNHCERFASDFVEFHTHSG